MAPVWIGRRSMPSPSQSARADRGTFGGGQRCQRDGTRRRACRLVGVHHIEGHIAANWLVDDLQDYGEIVFPAVCLIVSGGHTDLILMRGPR